MKLKSTLLWGVSLTNAVVYELEDRDVAYTGDDKADRHVYKFISSKPGSLKGTLYVADTINRGSGFTRFDTTHLQEKFKDQTEVLIRTREAAKLGATELNRPEDIEIDPVTGNIFISLTNNKHKKTHGSILKIENQWSFDALTFKASTFKAGSEENGFSVQTT